MTVTPDGWETDFRVVDTVRKPGGQVRSAAKFRVPDGQPRLEQA